MSALLLRLGGLALALGVGVRWLRVAQREHYQAGRCFWALRLWVRRFPLDAALLVLAGVALVTATVADLPALFVVTAVAGAVVPVRLALRGRTSPLRWTARLRRVAAVAGALEAVVVLVAPRPVAAVAVALPLLAVEVALLVLGPVENRIARRFVVQARRKLKVVAPTVVAITGSYGKTSTKQYLAHLLSGQRAVVPSPASFNNAMGLSRAVNEHLTPGTEVFIAEMGTYGPGEIRRLCELFPPDVAVITAVGEVHLERMGTLERVLEAKSEITETARIVVLNVDDRLLAGLATELGAAGRGVVRCSLRDPAAEVCLLRQDSEHHVWVRGTDLGSIRLPASVHAANAAVALGAALAVGASPGSMLGRLASLPSVAHRMEPQQTATGGWVLDDTYNSNPAGAAAALTQGAALATGTGGGLHVVTPGMVEMGVRQRERNSEFAEQIGRAGARTLVIVGRTNREPLRSGAVRSGASIAVVETATRQAAVDALASRLAAGDVVVFENDLPDHYP